MRGLRIGLVMAFLAGFFGVSAAQDAPKPAPGAPATDLAKELRECREQNGTVVQLWRDISQQRNAYEVQMASIRAVLGAQCPETAPVSQCVAALAAKAVAASAETSKTAPKPAPAPKK